MIRRTLLAGAAIALGLTIAFAQGAQRKQTPKALAEATEIGSEMAEGDIPFDATKAKKVLRVYAVAAVHSKKASRAVATTAAPEYAVGFRKRIGDFAAEIKTAAARMDTKESFTTAFVSVTNNCGGCHELYHIKQKP